VEQQFIGSVGQRQLWALELGHQVIPEVNTSSANCSMLKGCYPSPEMSGRATSRGAEFISN